MSRFSRIAVVATLLAGVPAAADPPEGGFIHGEGNLSLLTQTRDGPEAAGTFGYSFRGGYRWDGWGLFAQFEHNLWIAAQLQGEVVLGAYNIGLGGEYVYGDGLVRTSLAVGPSILAYDASFDEAGTTGVFVDLRPLGLRFSFNEHVALGVDPLGLAVVAPVISDVPLVKVEFRTAIYVEGDF